MSEAFPGATPAQRWSKGRFIKCAHCSRFQALLVCDFPTDNRVASYTTCSKPICDECVTKRGALDMCKEHSK